MMQGRQGSGNLVGWGMMKERPSGGEKESWMWQKAEFLSKWRSVLSQIPETHSDSGI